MLFYTPNIASNQELSAEETTHALRVLRLKNGDKVQLVDGKGGFYEAKIILEGKKCLLNVFSQKKDNKRSDTYIHLAIAPTKNIDRIEFMLEKCVEIGIDEVSFLSCRYSERKNIKLERLEKVAIQAMKQSLKTFLPKINEMIDFEKFLVRQNAENQLFVAHLEETERKLFSKEVYQCFEKKSENQSENQQQKTPQNTINASFCVLIGAEGDFSTQEIENAKKHNYVPVSLGNSRLRTETAGIFVCQTIEIIKQLFV